MRVRIRMAFVRLGRLLKSRVIDTEVTGFAAVNPVEWFNPPLSHPELKINRCSIVGAFLNKKFLKFILILEVGAIEILPKLPQEQEKNHHGQQWKYLLE